MKIKKKRCISRLKIRTIRTILGLQKNPYNPYILATLRLLKVISSDIPCKDDNARFTTVSIYLINIVEDILVFYLGFKMFRSNNIYLYVLLQ